MTVATTGCALVSVLVLAACGRCETEEQGSEPPAPVEVTMEDPAAQQRAAEERSRAAFFEFELTDVERSFGGDWVAFYENKTAEDRDRAATWHWDPSTPLDRRTPEDARARHALQLEHQRVVIQEMDAARQLAKEVATAILAGDVASVARGCVMYGSTPAGVESCEQHLNQQLTDMQRALRAMDPGAEDWGGSVGVDEPMPERGMPATAHVHFGPDVAAPADASPDGPRYPPRHEIQLVWSGPVMPESSGPVYAAPQADIPPRGRWRFHSFVFPYSHVMGALQ